jgi:uncharacterized membrane protein YkvA (DUF1232 family)
MDRDRSASEETNGAAESLSDIQAVIESAKARGGMEALERYIRKRLPEAEDAEVTEAAEVALEIIESVPVFLARARQAAAEQNMQQVVGPLLNHAERYFLQPMDLIPEMTQGLAGLLDDCYLFVRVIQHIEKGPVPFLDWDLDHPARFLRTLLGPEMTKRIDAIAASAVEQVTDQLTELWSRMGHDA